jgi:hypothetical protein
MKIFRMGDMYIVISENLVRLFIINYLLFGNRYLSYKLDLCGCDKYLSINNGRSVLLGRHQFKEI